MLLDTVFLMIYSVSSLELLCLASKTTLHPSLETTTSNSILIRRKSPSRMSLGGGRLSLINNRFSRKPRKKNLDPDQLLEILGNYYDPAWMSIEEPQTLLSKDPERMATYDYKQDGWQQAELLKQLQVLNLSSELPNVGALADDTLVKIVEKWLLRKASCPVRYAWENIGDLFWPHFIKRGECSSVPGTCSWPPGMHCVPSATTTMHVLRWQCKVPKGKGRRKNFKRDKDLKNKEWSKVLHEGDQPPNLKCSWIRVPYPITSECLCTC